MEALSALRQAFSLKKNEELGRKFPPEVLKKMVDAMKNYADSKCTEKRKLCQEAYDDVYESDECDPAFDNMYTMQELKDCETPDLD